MTVTPTYPGVYLYEIPSGNRPITGVATSITAFLGTAPRGPVDDPVPVFGFGDFERTFGGLSRDDGLGYAVRDFFLNGGGHALVVRIVHTPDEDPNTQDVGAVAAQIDVDGIILEATGPGAWGNALEVDVTHPAEDDPDSLDVAAAQGVPVSELFTLVVREGPAAMCPPRRISTSPPAAVRAPLTLCWRIHPGPGGRRRAGFAAGGGHLRRRWTRRRGPGPAGAGRFGLGGCPRGEGRAPHRNRRQRRRDRTGRRCGRPVHPDTDH